MTLRVRAAAPASEELEAAIRWYETQRRGLGAEFYAAVLECIELIKEHPEAGSLAFGDADNRRVLVARFPYQIIYRHRSKELVVIAFAHLKRRPGFWRNRERS